MWKNWFPFRRKEEKKVSTQHGGAETNGKENKTKHDAVAGRGRSTEGERANLSVQTTEYERLPGGSRPRSPPRRHGGFTEIKGSASATEQTRHPLVIPSRPLLSTPLLPKIKRAIELNDSASERSFSSPMTRSRMGVSRSMSLNYGPTHPTRTNPGRLPVVNLQRRPSLHQISSRRIQSPSTVKVAPPDRTMLSGSSFRASLTMSPTPASSPVVDTQTVLSALRERRKRSTATVTEDSVVEEEYTQMAKRRRQDSNLSTSSSTSIPPMPESLPDLSRRGNAAFTTLQHMEQMAAKRPPAPRRSSLDDSGGESQPTPKRERRHNNSRILSSLSSARAMSEVTLQPSVTEVPATTPTAKRAHSDSAGTAHREGSQPSKKQYAETQPCPKADTNTRVSSVLTPARSEPTPTLTKIKEKGDADTSAQKDSKTSTPRKKVLLNVLEHSSRRKIDVYAALRHPAVKQAVMVASAADLELDRKEEDARRVKDMLDFLDDDEDTDKTDGAATSATVTSGVAVASTAFKLSTSASLSTSAAASSLVSTTTSGKPTTTASSLSQLLAAPLNTSTSKTSTTTTLPSSLPKSVAQSPPATLTLGSGSLGGLVPSSGSMAAQGLVSSKPICSTGGEGFFSRPTGPTTSVAVSASMSAAAALASLSGMASLPASSLATPLATTLPSSLSASSSSGAGATSVPGSTQQVAASPPPQYTFKPVFGAKVSPSGPADAKPAPALGGFTFPGAAATAQSQSSAPAVATATSSAVPGGFNFGGVSSPPTTAAPAVGSSLTSSASQPFGGLGAFSAPQQTVTAAAPAAFGFGLAAGNAHPSAGPSTAPTASSGFNFGAAPSNPAPVSGGAPGFGLGGAAQQTSVPSSLSSTAAGGFSFGSLSAPSQGGQRSQQQQQQQNSAAPFGQSTQLSTSFASPSSAAKSFQPKNLFGTPKDGNSDPAANALGSSGGFGTPQGQSAAASPFGQSVPTGTIAATNSGFSFGPKPSAAGGSFSFGQQGSTGVTTFGATTATASAGGSGGGGFSFGGAAPSMASSGSAGTGGFSFGQTAPAATTSANAFGGFGQSQPAASGGGQFGFGGTQATAAPSAGPPAFGASATSSAAPGFNFGSAATATTASAAAQSAGFNFGAGATAGTKNASGGFSFGSVAPATTNPQAAGFNFGSTAGTTSAQPAGFNLGAGAKSATPTPSAGFNFGAVAKTTAGAGSGGFNFGPAAASTTAAAPPPNTSVLGFGQAKTQTQPGAFGSPTPATFNFGSSQPRPRSAAPAFGSQPQVASPFSATTTQSQTLPPFGSSFSSSAAPSTNPGFNFGAVATGTPSAAPAFGSATPQPQQAPAFGNSVAQPSVFGATASHSNTSTPVFGASGNQNTSAVTQSNAFAFGAGGQPAPAGFAFGGGGGGGGSGGMAFGGNAASTAGGFDFSSSLSGGPQFNFGTNPQGQGNMFTTGATNTAPKPRGTAVRARRRGNANRR